MSLFAHCLRAIQKPVQAFKGHTGLLPRQDFGGNTDFCISTLPHNASVLVVCFNIVDFEFIVQEKYKIAKDRPGSGNTKNIGSCVKIADLKGGSGPFSKYGVKTFDDYWMHYMTAEMARNAKLRKPPYTKLEEYLQYRNIKNI